MSPDDKLALVRRLQAAGARVAMIGDGINDAPVLAGADVSIALADGADIARTQADLVVTGSSLVPASRAFDLGPQVMRIIRQNLAWAFGYNLIALPAAATGFVSPWLAAIGMSASSLLVVANGRRAGRIHEKTGAAEKPQPAPPNRQAAGACRPPDLGRGVFMTIIYVLIPLSIVMRIIAVGASFCAVRSGQFDDPDTPALDILDDDEYPKERKPNSNSDDRPGQGRDTP